MSTTSSSQRRGGVRRRGRADPGGGAGVAARRVRCDPGGTHRRCRLPVPRRTGRPRSAGRGDARRAVGRAPVAGHGRAPGSVTDHRQAAAFLSPLKQAAKRWAGPVGCSGGQGRRGMRSDGGRGVVAGYGQGGASRAGCGRRQRALRRRCRQRALRTADPPRAGRRPTTQPAASPPARGGTGFCLAQGHRPIPSPGRNRLVGPSAPGAHRPLHPAAAAPPAPVRRRAVGCAP